MRDGIVVIGTSLGGLEALEELLAALPPGFRLPVAVAQHRSAESGGSLRTALQRHTSLKVIEPQDKTVIDPGSIYLAPADYHLLVETGIFALSTEAPVAHARPSIDVLFESAADAYRERAIGVVLTGASSDGARGVARIKERGGKVVVQDPAAAECAVMPRAALAAVAADEVLPIAAIAQYLVRLCGSNGS